MHGLRQINRMNRVQEIAKSNAKFMFLVKLAGITLAIVGLFVFGYNLV